MCSFVHTQISIAIINIHKALYQSYSFISTGITELCIFTGTYVLIMRILFSIFYLQMMLERCGRVERWLKEINGFWVFNNANHLTIYTHFNILRTENVLFVIVDPTIK